MLNKRAIKKSKNQENVLTIDMKSPSRGGHQPSGTDSTDSNLASFLYIASFLLFNYNNLKLISTTNSSTKLIFIIIEKLKSQVNLN